MRWIAARFIALFAFTLLTACGGQSPAPPSQNGPALWQVKRGAINGWLLGTIHVLPRNTGWQTPAITQAMADADQLVLEAADIQDPSRTMALFEQMGRSPSLPPLDTRVPEKDRPALDQLVRSGGTSTQALSGYESWAAAMLLSAANQQALGVSQEDGVETTLIAAFRKAAKPIGGLETVERQFGAFDTLPEAAQNRLLIQTVHEAKDMKGLYDRILKAWLAGDMAAIAREDQNGQQPDPLVEEAVLVRRNHEWVKAIETLDGRPFIAVGTGHLTGRDNLITLLQARGFAVTRVQ
ncbi:MAG: TraB/GumN family protein [Sphingobium sp.]